MGEERFGPYELVRRVAVGGMAEIFVARRSGPSGFAKQVALKRVLPELARQEAFRQMFADEARLCASLSHPGLVAVFDYGEVDGTPYLAMEWIEGCDLTALVATCGPLEPEVAAFVMAEVARSLAYVHEARDEEGHPLGIVHRDLSPGNVLVSRQGDVKLGDFGVAKARGRLARTDAGSLKGTLAYLAPEQVTGGTVDGRTDVYAAGLLLFELATGERYVRGDGEVDLLRAAAAPERRAASAVRPGLEKLDAALARALSVEPEARHGDAGALERELRPLAGDPAKAREALASRVARACGVEAPRRRTELVCGEAEAAADRRRAWLRRRARPLGAAAAALALAAAGLGLWLTRSPPGAGAASIAGPEPRAPASALDGRPADGRDGGPQPAPAEAAPPRGAASALDGRPADGRDGGLRPAPAEPAPPRRHVASALPGGPRDDGGRGEPEGPTVEPPGPTPPATAPPDRALREADRLRAGRGIRGGDDEAADRLRAAASALVASGAPAAEVDAACRAYAERVGAIAIDRPFIDRKMRRATERIRRAGATDELDRLSQQAIRQVMAGDLEEANRTLNRILDLAR